MDHASRLAGTMASPACPAGWKTCPTGRSDERRGSPHAAPRWTDPPCGKSFWREKICHITTDNRLQTTDYRQISTDIGTVDSRQHTTDKSRSTHPPPRLPACRARQTTRPAQLPAGTTRQTNATLLIRHDCCRVGRRARQLVGSTPLPAPANLRQTTVGRHQTTVLHYKTRPADCQTTVYL